MDNRLLLIDGSAILTTGFYGNTPNGYLRAKTTEERNAQEESLMQTSDGIFTNGVFYFAKILKTIEDCGVCSHLAIAWDKSRNTFRKKLYPDYKGHRPESPRALKQQFDTMQKTLDYIGAAQFVFEDYEADDILGSLAARFKRDIPVAIYTKDTDALQLVEDNVSVWLHTGKVNELGAKFGVSGEALPKSIATFPEMVKEIMGVLPFQIPCYKGLCGDTADNIPGLRGIGPATASTLLEKYKDLETLQSQSADTVVAETGVRHGIAELIEKDAKEKNIAGLSKKLGKIVTEIKELNGVSLSDLEYKIGPRHKEKIYRRLELLSLI